MSAKVNSRLGNPVSMALNVANQILGRCRAMAHKLKQGSHQRSAGNEGKAQHLEHVARSGGPVTAKERAAKARELVARRRDGAVATPDLKAQAASHREGKGSRGDRLNTLAAKAERIAQGRYGKHVLKAIDADKLKATASKPVLRAAAEASDRAKVDAILARRRANALDKAGKAAKAKPPATIGGEKQARPSAAKKTAAESKAAQMEKQATQDYSRNPALAEAGYAAAKKLRSEATPKGRNQLLPTPPKRTGQPLYYAGRAGSTDPAMRRADAKEGLEARAQNRAYSLAKERGIPVAERARGSEYRKLRAEVLKSGRAALRRATPDAGRRIAEQNKLAESRLPDRFPLFLKNPATAAKRKQSAK